MFCEKIKWFCFKSLIVVVGALWMTQPLDGGGKSHENFFLFSILVQSTFVAWNRDYPFSIKHHFMKPCVGTLFVQQGDPWLFPLYKFVSFLFFSFFFLFFTSNYHHSIWSSLYLLLLFSHSLSLKYVVTWVNVAHLSRSLWKILTQQHFKWEEVIPFIFPGMWFFFYLSCQDKDNW